MQRLNVQKTTSFTLAAACSVTAAGAFAQTGFTTVDYSPTVEANSGGFIPGIGPIPGSLADGPFTTGGTVVSGNTDTPLVQDGATVFAGTAAAGSFGSFNDARRTVFEYDLAAVRQFSSDPAEVLDATFSFVFDDVLFTSQADRLVSDFTVEVFTDSADGTLVGGLDGTENADFEGGAIASLSFADDSGIVFPDLDPAVSPTNPESLRVAATVAGPIDGPALNFVADYADADLDARGFIGFEIDVTSVVADLIDDPSVSHIGFRLLSNEPVAQGFNTGTTALTSLDRSGFGPNLVVDVVPEPASAALLGAGAGLLAYGRRRK